MNKPEPRKFDFREIAALDDTAVSLRDWVSKSSSFFSEFWDRATGYSAQLSLGGVTTESYEATLKSVSKENNYCIAGFQDQMSTMWYASSNQLRVIVAEMLCSPNNATAEEESEEPVAEGEDKADDEDSAAEENADAGEPEGEDLTPIEVSLVDFFLGELAKSLNSGWAGDQKVTVAANALDKDPRKTLLFRQRDLVTKVDLDIELQSRQTTIHWLLPKQGMSEVLGSLTERRATGNPTHPPVEVVSRMPLAVVAVIGETTIPMPDLSKLKRGQLIKLDQRIDQPIVAYVNDQPYYECWPGKIGSKQSVEISKCLRGDLAGGIE